MRNPIKSCINLLVNGQLKSLDMHNTLDREQVTSDQMFSDEISRGYVTRGKGERQKRR